MPTLHTNIPNYISFASLNKTHQQACRENGTIDIIPNWLYKDILLSRYKEELENGHSKFWKWRHQKEIEQKLSEYNRELCREIIW